MYTQKTKPKYYTSSIVASSILPRQMQKPRFEITGKGQTNKTMINSRPTSTSTIQRYIKTLDWDSREGNHTGEQQMSMAFSLLNDHPALKAWARSHPHARAVTRQCLDDNTWHSRAQYRHLIRNLYLEYLDQEQDMLDAQLDDNDSTPNISAAEDVSSDGTSTIRSMRPEPPKSSI